MFVHNKQNLHLIYIKGNTVRTQTASSQTSADRKKVGQATYMSASKLLSLSLSHTDMVLHLSAR